MSGINNPIVNGKIVPDDSIAMLDRPRTLIVGTIPTNKNGIFGSKKYAWLQRGVNTSYELADNATVSGLVGTGSVFHRWAAAKKGSNNDVPIDFLLVKNEAATTATTTITFTDTPTGGSVTRAFII